MTLRDFWDGTIREVLMLLRADRWRYERTERVAVAASWHAVNLERASSSNKFPAMRDYLYPKHSKAGAQQMTPKQEWSRWEALASINNAQQALKSALATADAIKPWPAPETR